MTFPLDDMPDAPAFILVRPQMGENIGAAARGMWNFGLDRMRVVDPRDGWPSPKAVAMASGAGRLLDTAGPFADLPAAIADCEVVYATTARQRGMTKAVLSPEEAMAQARAHIAAGRRVGVMFGPERAGLENDDLVRADAIISVPVNPDFPSLNLAQCVLLVAYEWRRQVDAGAPLPDVVGGVLANGAEIDHLGSHFEEKLEAAGFFYPADKAPYMRLSLRNMLGRLPLTKGDVQVFHGMLRQIARAARGPEAGATAKDEGAGQDGAAQGDDVKDGDGLR